MIGNQKSIPIQWLAERLHYSQQKVIEDLREAIAWGLFPDAYIQEKTGMLLFPGDDVLGAVKTVLCPNCGAGSEVIVGYPAKCKYCGFALETDAEE